MATPLKDEFSLQKLGWEGIIVSCTGAVRGKPHLPHDLEMKVNH